MELLYLIGWIVGYLVVMYIATTATWMMYLAIMHLRQVRNTVGLTTPQKVVGYPALFLIGLPLDFTYNMLASFVFLEPPRELLFTARCHRHYKKDTWRGQLARWCCKHFLEPFDVGHCQ